MQIFSRKPIRILVVEDDMAQQALLCSWLKAEGYSVDAFSNGLQARNHLADHWADLLIFDWDVPGISGEKLLAWVRGRSQSSVPVIFQTVHSAESDIVQILDAGADDYLVKPLDRQVLLARIRVLLRRATRTNGESRRMLVGECVLDRSSQALVHAGTPYRLGTKEFDILWHLASHIGTVVQRQDLMSVVWGWDAAVQSRSVDMYVSRLRTALKGAGVSWNVQSVYATGYRLNVDQPDETRKPEAPAADADAAQNPAPAPASSAPEQPDGCLTGPAGPGVKNSLSA
ncbi:DNA-binding response regulator [Burkholderia sp. WAC0059]|uniref:response regulator transcription factor n=1 Tax=Burkholderia sp. WAC0059 TaxID=2066022 RepID=UPI000C7F732C|nr:response regulator transcription factor [Burkholderia sp. WAC0059]PLZ00481.1 DNA-binding response regulator [Burkholderia sp. WAC0059]